MGSLIGHIVPGCTLILAGLWWWWNNAYNYYKSRFEDNGISFRSRSSFSTLASREQNGRRFHLEAVVSLLLFLTSILMELYAGIFINGNFVDDPNIYQHIAMFTCGVLRSLVVLVCYNSDWLPPEMEQWTTGVAFFLEGPLFYSHITGKASVEGLVHILTALCFLIGGVSCLFEYAFPRSIMAAFSKSYFVAVGALWLLHGGGILMYVEPYNTNLFKLMEHAQFHFVTAYFTYDAVLTAVVMLLMAAFINVKVKRSHGRSSPGTYKRAILICNGELGEESEEDVLVPKKTQVLR